ncbi:hypothetical protein FOL47_008685 [Perkinsus chesapeaki]|uniref:Uncharacterized protein n=1 Tax=Perkinsus chesapeaki TaxID=330153 RepID=A0A7J6MTX9_PERCH|nr:hypothetical protein FOL47_008685 [Perkinsus chesapeaki]
MVSIVVYVNPSKFMHSINRLDTPRRTSQAAAAAVSWNCRHDGICNMALTGETAPSFGLSINENCDPTVQSDHLAAFRRLDPNGFQSGPVLARGSLSLPIRDGKLKRGIYLMNCSHKDSRAVIAVTCIPAVSTKHFEVSGARGAHIIPREKYDRMLAGDDDVVINFTELHTSASLSILDGEGEEAKTLEETVSKVVPETWNYDIFQHVYEGPDDMPGHMKSTLLGCSHSLSSYELNDPEGARPYLTEHRNSGGWGVGHTRTLELTAVKASKNLTTAKVKVDEEVMNQLDLACDKYSMVHLSVYDGYSLVVGCDIIPSVRPEILPYAAVGNGRTVDVPLKQGWSYDYMKERYEMKHGHLSAWDRLLIGTFRRYMIVHKVPFKKAMVELLGAGGPIRLYRGLPVSVLKAAPTAGITLMANDMLKQAFAAIGRSPRDMSSLRMACSTGNSVGPGSYDPKKPRGGPITVYEEVNEDGTVETIQLFKRGTEVPFQSLEEKFAVYNRANASKTPGPGTYAPMLSCSKDCGKSAGYGLKSRSARLAPVAPGSSQYTASTVVDNPGPGAYFSGDDMTNGPSVRRRSEAPIRIPTSRVSASIPVRRLLPGDTVKDSAIPTMDFTGDKDDTCGPDRYSIESARRVTGPGVRDAQWHKYREQRKVFQPSHSISNELPDPVVPGPGQYHGMNHNNRKLPSLGTSQFRSRVPMAHQIVVYPEGKVGGSSSSQYGDELVSTAANTATTTGGFTDGGNYCGHYSSARMAIAAHKAAVAPFSSSVPRSDGWARTVEAPYTTSHRGGPGPGAYRQPRSNSLKDAVTVLARPGGKAAGTDSFTTKTIKHKLTTVEGVHVRMVDDPVVTLGQHRRYYGVHNPLNMAIVSEALDNREPMISFNTTDGRPCNKPLLQTSPGPDKYANGEALSISKATMNRATVGRRGVFGTCASRSAGSAFVDSKDSQGKRKRHELEEEMDNLNSPRMEPRKGANYRMIKVVRDNSMKRVVEPPVKCQGPGPASYSPREPEGGAYRNPYRLGKKNHLSFGSANERFGKSGGVFMAADVPGPGQYSSTQVGPKQPGGAANTAKSKRFGSGVVGVDYTAITSTDGAVGPGSYDQQRADNCSVMASKTHNVTMNTPWAQLKSAAKNNRKVVVRPNLVRFRGVAGTVRQ